MTLVSTPKRDGHGLVLGEVRSMVLSPTWMLESFGILTSLSLG